MTRKERVQRAVGHKRTDIVPYNIELTSVELAKVASHLGIKPEDFFEFAGNHIEKASYNIGGNNIGDGLFQDEFGVKWDRSGLDKDIGIISEIILKEPRLNGYKFPNPPVEQIKIVTEKVLNNGRDTFKFGKIGTTYFERAWSLRGMENLLMDFHLEPAFVEQLFDRILEYNLAIIESAAQYDIDGFYFGDDYGQQTGLLMSPDTWRRFIKPGLAKMFGKVKATDKVVALHSCGNVSEILGDLIDIGLDIYQTVQPEVYDLKKLKADYGKHLTFWGAISTQRTLPFVRPDELKRIVRETIDIMAVDGGYIAGPTHRVPGDVPPENVVALIEILKGQ
jgi:uroporphyrinogen decarboxylase